MPPVRRGDHGALGLVNAVVPKEELRAEVRRWADEMLAKSPTALKVLKHSFNADSEAIAGIGTLAFDSLDLFVQTEEAREGVAPSTRSATRLREVPEVASAVAVAVGGVEARRSSR